MEVYDVNFDAKEWIREHGVAAHGRSLTLHLDTDALGATLHIPSCAYYDFPELGLSQDGNKHQGFRGTISDLLEKARADIEESRSIYGEEAAPKFDALLERINGALESQTGAPLTLHLRDPSGLIGVPLDLQGCIASDEKFERREAENMLLIPLGAPEPGEQLETAKQIAELVQRARRIVALTGAGISVESGITPFRKGDPSDKEKGSIWGKFDAAKMTVQNFNSDPDVTLGWWEMKRSLVSEMRTAVPNDAHKFFAAMEKQGKLKAVVTQNIDSLHQAARVSAEKVIELHGHMRGLVCSDLVTPLNPVPYKNGSCTFCIASDDTGTLQKVYSTRGVPVCPDCGCPMRTETVMFGQPMPLHAVDAACKAIEEADLLFIIGSTLIVAPANELPCIALRNGVPVVIINFDSTQYDAYAKGLVRQKAGEFLGDVLKELNEMPEIAAPAPALQKKQKPTADEMKQSKRIKEWTRLGKEIAVNAKACGIAFYCAAVPEVEGDFDLLGQSLSVMDVESTGIGKMLFSDGLEQLAILAYVPEGLTAVLDLDNWLHAVARAIGGTIVELTSTSGKLVVRASTDVYPIKLKEPGVTAAIQFLKDAGLFPIGNDDDDDMIFGDEDFPM